MKVPNDKELDRAVNAAFRQTWKDIEFWNGNIAGTPRTPWHPEDLEPRVEFSHREWAIATLWNLVHEGFDITGDVMLEVTRLTGCNKINAD